MRFSYNKLWKLLIDRGIKKKELAEKAELSATSIAKLGKGGNINTKVLLNICTALECNIEDINFHALRHTFATRCVELGFDIKSLSEILGHANVNITLNRYVHPSMNLKQQNMSKLSDLFTVK